MSIWNMTNRFSRNRSWRARPSLQRGVLVTKQSRARVVAIGKYFLVPMPFISLAKCNQGLIEVALEHDEKKFAKQLYELELEITINSIGPSVHCGNDRAP
jgi:hypothetical protein